MAVAGGPPAVRATMSFVTIVLCAATLYNLVLVGLILQTTQQHRAGRTFAWYIFAAAAWTGVIAAAQLVPDRVVALWLLRITHLCGISINIAFVWFCTRFPREAGRFRYVAWAITITGLLWYGIAMTPWLVQNAQIEDWGVDIIAGPAMGLYSLWYMLGALAGMAHLVTKAYALRGLERLQVNYLLLGSVGFLIVGAGLTLVVPSVIHSYRWSPLSPLSSLCITTAATYAIARYRLMDIRLVLRTGLIYTISVMSVALLTALLVFPAMGFLRMEPTLTAFWVALVVALAFQPMRRVVEVAADRWLFKSFYDERGSLDIASQQLASAHDREAVVDILIATLTRTMKPRGMAAYLPVGRECLGRAASNGSAIAIPEMLPAADLVVAYAVQSDTVLLAEELQRLSSAHRAVATRMKAWGAYVALPLLAGNQVCGVIFLGEKVSGDIYNTNDVSFLRILGKQAAVALDNAQHYQEIVVLNDYHERMLHTMQDGVIAVDPDHRIITFNPAAESITGVPAAEALGNPLALLDLPQLPVTSTGEHPQEIMITTRDGTETPLLVSVTPFTHRGDDVHSLLIVFRDLSALRALEQEKVQAERFSSMGAMAASLAHEIKNPLVPIRTFAHLLPTMYDDPEFREEFGHTVVNEVDRINRLVGQMLDLVRRPAGAREPVDLAEVLHKLLLLVRPQCDAADVALNTRIPETLPPIMGFAEQLYQAILNILMNAVQAMPDGGQLAVEVDVDDAQMICRITDTGPGVPPEALRHIFEPLFTTKEGGHGLGLALTYQFVRAHGGDIRAECAPGSGLIVIVSLPIARQEADLLCT